MSRNHYFELGNDNVDEHSSLKYYDPTKDEYNRCFRRKQKLKPLH